MKIRILLLAAALATAAANALALSPENEAWGKSGVVHLFTDEEAAAWKAIKTDEEARAFIDLFWARRDPTPATPENEFKQSTEMRIKYADEKFAPARKKMAGSATERGMMLIVFGQPHRMANKGATQQFGETGSAGRLGVGTPGSNVGEVRSAVSDRLNSYQTWVYEGEHVRQLFGVPRAEFTFVDRTNTNEFGLERGGAVDVAAWKKKVVASYVTQPDLTRAPEFRTVPMAGSTLAAAAGPMTALTTPALATAVAEVKAATANPLAGNAFATWSEFVTPEGQYFVPVLLYVPKSSPAAAGTNVTFFGVIEDESGKPVLAFEEKATLVASMDDFFVNKSLTGLPAGKHRGYFGLAAGGKTLAIAPAEMQLAGSLDQSVAAVSPLMLSNNVYALTESQRPTDPFAFGGTKVVPKADKTFKSSDELWYFFIYRNPGAGESGTPKVQVKVDITGKTKDGTPVKKSAPLTQADAMALKGATGQFAIGNAIPLANFKAGDYSIAVRVIDTVTKASHTLSDTFRIAD